MTTAKDDQTINTHYGRGDLDRRILNGLQAAGKSPQQLEPNDLTPVDQFHIGGKDTTLQLMRLVGVQPGMEVLDVGGGLGGPARTLAAPPATRPCKRAELCRSRLLVLAVGPCSTFIGALPVCCPGPGADGPTDSHETAGAFFLQISFEERRLHPLP